MAVLERLFTTPHPVDLRLTLSPLRHGAGDPCTWLRPDGLWRATRTPDGPATVRLSRHADRVAVRAWGPGAAWAVDAAAQLVGTDDDVSGFRPAHPVVAGLARRLPGLRISRSQAVVEAMVPTILAQKVTGKEAGRGYRALVRALGERAPGPAGDGGLLVPPAPSRLAGTPSYAFHPFGIERRRAETVRLTASVAPRLEEATRLPPVDAHRRLRAVPGIGPWTAGWVALVALGDADAVPVGDFHIPDHVSWALCGEPRGDDDRMLELLEPFRGHRGRVIRLIMAGGTGAPRFGPRLAVRSISSI